MYKERNHSISKQDLGFFKVELENGVVLFCYGRNETCAKSRAWVLSKGKTAIKVTKVNPDEFPNVYFK
jgi:hypothetical protein